MTVEIIRVYNEDLAEKLNVAVGMMLGEVGARKMRPLNMLEIKHLIGQDKISKESLEESGIMSSSWYQQMGGMSEIIHGIMPTFGGLSAYLHNSKLGHNEPNEKGNLITEGRTKLRPGWIGSGDVVREGISSRGDFIDFLLPSQTNSELIKSTGGPYIFSGTVIYVKSDDGVFHTSFSQAVKLQSKLSRKENVFSNVFFPREKLSSGGADAYNRGLEGEILMVPSDATTYDVLAHGKL